MALISTTGFSHIRLTVSDIARSAAFYDALLGWPRVIDFSEESRKDGFAPGPANFYGGVMYRSPDGIGLGLRPVGLGTFNPDVLGLDHLSFAVASMADLKRAHEALAHQHIELGEIQELSSGIAILSLQDPDGISLELTAQLG